MFHMVELNFLGEPLSTARPLSASASNNNSNIAVAVVSGLTVDIQAVGVGTTVVTISDGRGGVANVTGDVTVIAAPAGTLVVGMQDAVRVR